MIGWRIHQTLGWETLSVTYSTARSARYDSLRFLHTAISGRYCMIRITLRHNGSLSRTALGEGSGDKKKKRQHAYEGPTAISILFPLAPYLSQYYLNRFVDVAPIVTHNSPMRFSTVSVYLARLQACATIFTSNWMCPTFFFREKLIQPRLATVCDAKQTLRWSSLM